MPRGKVLLYSPRIELISLVWFGLGMCSETLYRKQISTVGKDNAAL